MPAGTTLPAPPDVSREDFTWDNIQAWLMDVPLAVLTILVVAWVARWLLHRGINGLIRSMQWKRNSGDSGSLGVIDPLPTSQLPTIRKGFRRAARVLNVSELVNTDRQAQRLETLGSLLRSIVSVFVWVIAAILIGYELGINMGPIIASAGVGGVALAFGAQSLVKDFLSGLFMMFEDQYGVGDLIDTGEAVGTVEEVTLRVTRLRDATGVVWYVRNGEIIRIANRTQGYQTGIIDIPVSIQEDPTRVIAILEEVVAAVYADPAYRPSMLEEPNVAGVETLEGGTMTIRIFAKCVADKQWGVMREIRERGKKALTARGVKGPLLAVPDVPLGYTGATQKPISGSTSTVPKAHGSTADSAAGKT